MKNFRISYIAVIGLASLIFVNNIFALGVPTIPAVPEVVPEVPAVPEVVPEVPAVPEVVPEDIIPPALDTETLSTWVSSFEATLVNNNVTNTIMNQTQIPQIITSGANFTDELIDSQSSVLLDVSFPSLTDGLTITNAIGLPNYTIPDVASVISTIPTIVTSSNSTTGQFIVAPLGQIIPGQQIIIIVEDSVIPSYGGLKEIALQSAIGATSVGNTIEEWMTIEVDNKIPSSLPTTGLAETPIIFVNVQYPYEQTGIGFNWGDPANYASPPTMTLVVNKTDSDSVQKDSQGCPLVDPYTLSSGVWTGNGLGEIFSRSTGPDKCEVTIQTQHFSKFAFSLRHITSIHSSSPGTFSLGSVVTKSSMFTIPDKEIKTGLEEPTVTARPYINPLKTILARAEGFENLECSKGFGHAQMIGQYTNGKIPYSVIFLRMTLFDSAGKILTTGSGSISNIDADTTKFFNAIARYHTEFDSCSIQIDSAIPKSRN